MILGKILKNIKKLCGGIWIGLIWVKIWSCSGLMWFFEFSVRRGILSSCRATTRCFTELGSRLITNLK
jgi:hypothetical protein